MSAWTRPAVSGCRSQQQPVCGVCGGFQGGSGEGLWPDSDGGD